jgi:hypothetical protein
MKFSILYYIAHLGFILVAIGGFFPLFKKITTSITLVYIHRFCYHIWLFNFTFSV